MGSEGIVRSGDGRAARGVGMQLGRRARQLCPDLVFVGGHFDEYQRLGDAAIGVLSDFTPAIERISIDEADFDNPDANPLNHGGDVHEWDSDRRETIVRTLPAKPMDDWKSLKAEGFKAVSYIHGAKCDRSCKHDKDVEVQAGHEIALED